MPDDVEVVAFLSAGIELYGRLRSGADEPTVVLLSGLGFHTFEYEPLAAALATTGIGAFSFDFRGHGRSGGERGRWSLDDLAADTVHAVDYLSERGSGPLFLFGNSLGAMVAIMAGARDDRVAGVVAANCPARIGDFLLTGPRRMLFAVVKLVEPLLPVRISVNRFYAYEQLIDDDAWIATIRGDPLVADARRLSVRTLRSLLDGWDGPRAVRRLREPLLVVQGRRDRLQPPEQSRLVFEAAVGPKRLAQVGTGHLPHLEAPAIVATAMSEWLSEIGGSP
jgi:alpha-beta hydrolase superfamily lysophospholipase